MHVYGLQGFNDSGMEDLLSGTVSGAFYLGGGAAPALAGTINSLFGFGWACTGMGFLMLLEAIALLILLLFLRKPPDKSSRTSDEEQAPAQHDSKPADPTNLQIQGSSFFLHSLDRTCRPVSDHRMLAMSMCRSIVAAT